MARRTTTRREYTIPQSTLDWIREAIQNKRAYLRTAFGPFLVRSFDSFSGWVVCNNTDSEMNQRSFLVAHESILIADAPIRVDRRVVKHSSFEFEGKTVPVTSSEIETTWHWPVA